MERLKNFLYRKETYILYKYESIENIYSNALIRKVNFDIIDDALSFNSKSKIQKYRELLESGDVGYYAYLDNVCVHRSWYTKGPQIRRVIHNYFMTFYEDDIYIFNCATSEKAKGLNIYPSVLRYLCEENPNKNLYLIVSSKKPYAIRGVEKAGFRANKYLHYTCYFGVKKFREINAKESR